MSHPEGVKEGDPVRISNDATAVQQAGCLAGNYDDSAAGEIAGDLVGTPNYDAECELAGDQVGASTNAASG